MKKRLKLSMLFSARQREPAREPPGKPAGSGFVQVVGDPFNIYRAFAQAALQHAARGGRVVFASGVEAASDELHQAIARPLEAVRGVEDLLRPPEGAFPKPSSPL